MRNRSRSAVVLCMLALIASACNLPLTPVPGRGTTPAPVPGTGAATAAPGVPNTGGTGEVVLAVRQSGKYGPILVDGAGRTLYIFTQDTTNTPTCLDGCTKLWLPLLDPSGSVAVQAGVTSSLIALVGRPLGARQLVYNGHPLYYFAKDVEPGQIKGEGFKGAWFVVSPSGVPVQK